MLSYGMGLTKIGFIPGDPDDGPLTELDG